MTHTIHPICLSTPLNLGTVNCYLIKTGASFILIDTGGKNQRAVLKQELERLGCKPDNLQLIIITHGDFDHTSNAAYLRQQFAAKIAMHTDDVGMAERGDMFWNRKRPNFLVRVLANSMFGFGKAERFSPDIHLADGFDLSVYGFEAQVLSIPGHSKGSIGILTAQGELFCGDLLENTKKPALNSLMDDLATAKTSIEKLKGFNVQTVYAGHGEPFAFEAFLKELQQPDAPPA
jgi:hydroxyacylglutathione hydrolase